MDRASGVRGLPVGYRQVAPLLLQADVQFSASREAVESRLAEGGDQSEAQPAATGE